MVLGEYEILGQVRAALAEAQELGQAGSVLASLFQQAVKTGKRARSETAISSGIFSVGQCAVRVTQQALGGLEGKRVLVFGAGRMARTATKHLTTSRAGVVSVFSRTHSRAQELAESLGGEAISAEQLPAAFRASDIVLGCASAPHHVIGLAELQEAMGARPERPMVVVDLGVPRNVDPAVGSLPHVTLFNLDDLQKVVSENAKAREAEVERVRGIIAEEMAGLQCPEEQEQTNRLIVELRARAEKLRQECLSRAGGRLSGGEEAELLDYVTDLLVRKLLHQPIIALKEAACAPNGREADVASLVSRIFGLNGRDLSAVADEENLQPKGGGTLLEQGREREGVCTKGECVDLCR
jgi:glutamyl-tRNA reductase